MRSSLFFSTTAYRRLAIAWTLGMLTAFSLPATSVPNVDADLGVDKLVHFGLFFGFALLWMRGLCPPRTESLTSRLWQTGRRFVGIGICFSVGTELYQWVLPIRRMADPYDAGANVAGLFAGLLVYVAVVRWTRARAAVPRDNRNA